MCTKLDIYLGSASKSYLAKITVFVIPLIEDIYNTYLQQFTTYDI